LETSIDKEDVQVHRIEEGGALSTATDKKDSPDELVKKPAHLRRCGDKKATAMVAAMKKDEKHRRLLDLPTEEWRGSLDEDVKADRVDFYYEEKKRKREEKKRKRDEKKRESEENGPLKKAKRIHYPKKRASPTFYHLPRSEASKRATKSEKEKLRRAARTQGEKNDANQNRREARADWTEEQKETRRVQRKPADQKRTRKATAKRLSRQAFLLQLA
jgi:hypothetical protein